MTCLQQWQTSNFDFADFGCITWLWDETEICCTLIFIEASLSKSQSLSIHGRLVCAFCTHIPSIPSSSSTDIERVTETFMVGIKKWHAFVDTTSIPVPLCRYKRSSGRHKCSSGKSIELHFRMYWCMKPALFGRSLPILRRKPSNLWCSCTTNAHSEKCSEGWRLFWMHARPLFPAWCIMFVYTETFIIVFTINYLHVLLVVKRNSAYGFPASYTVSAHTDQISV